MAGQKQLEAMKYEKEIKKLRLKYEILARTEVNGRLSEINKYLSKKAVEQEQEDKGRDQITKEIQADYAARLQQSREELTRIKEEMQGTKIGILSLQNQLKERENELCKERKLRKQLEEQVDTETEKRLIKELLPASSIMNNNVPIPHRVVHQPLIIEKPRQRVVTRPRLGAYF